MSAGPSTNRNRSSIELELYFLIERFLSTGPCQSAARILSRELGEHGLELNRHIGGFHLLQICERLGPLLDEKVRPNIMGVKSLLGAGSQSLLRTEKDMHKLEWPPEAHLVLQHGRSLQPPVNLVTPNMLFVSRGREMSGQAHFNHVMSIPMYDNLKLHSRKLGHLSAVYCCLFDRTGEVIFTGADDLLVKIWQLCDGRLKATLRGHSAEITDMTVNHANTLLASGSCDKTIRVWCLKTKAPVVILQGHTGMVTSLQFSPMAKGSKHYLASTGGDACVCFWEWEPSNNKFNMKPMKFIERSRAGAQITCSNFSPGGMFFAAGSSDNVIRMYQFMGGFPEKIGELEKHTDRVDSICYANHDNRFLSGSRDNTARIWKFERNEWRNIELKMNMKLKKKESFGDNRLDYQTERDYDIAAGDSKLKVTMVGWNMDDTVVVTAISDFSIKVWCSHTGELQHILRAHEDEVYVIESSPIDRRILLSAGHDGYIIIWDIIQGVKVKTFFNRIEGQGHGAVFDCKFSPDGTSFAATDSHGHIMIHGLGSNEKHKKIPEAVFFHTDYRPLMRDSNNYVLDEQTQQAPHLMPPPFLVDIDGNPYPGDLQRLVPGRENCLDDQLVPQLAVNEDGAQEVMGDQVPEPVAVLFPEGPTPAPVGSVSIQEAGSSPQGAGQSGEVSVEHRPSIDHMIVALQRQQDQRMAARGEVPLASPPPQLGSPQPPALGSPRAVNRSNSVAGTGSSHMVGMRQERETEGVRQSLGNIQQVSTSKDIAALGQRIVVKGLDLAVLRKNEEIRVAMAEAEVLQYKNERKKKNMVRRDAGDEPGDSGIKTRKKTPYGGGQTTRTVDNEDTATNRLTRRALYDTDDEIEEELGPMDWNEEDLYNGDSSDYSDWDMGTGSNLQPPTRKSKRVVKRKRYTTTEDSEEEVEHDSDIEDVHDSGETSQPRETRETRGKALKKKDKQPGKTRRGKKIQTASDAAQLPGRSSEDVKVLLERHRPPDWLTDVLARKQPYFPQMGDELMYFRQGHELYVKEVEKRKVYPIDLNKNQPWHKNPSLREQELVRIVGVRYEILKIGVRLCCLKLNYIDPVTLKNTGGCLHIKYHDMPDVVDFLVLKQNYDNAVQRNYKPGDRFRSMIDDSWWMGIIETHIPYQEEYPDSLFQCFKVRWDNCEREHLSPWDMEPADDLRAPSVIGGGILVTPQELKALMYRHKPSDWPTGDMDEECDRIVRGIEQVMEHSIAEPFLTPVDLNVFPSYAMSIEYPMDLNTIKRRLENRFYRRVTALQFDIRYIEANTRKYNEPRSQIVKSAQVSCDALLSLISDSECTDPYEMISKLSKGRKIQWSSDNDSGEETEDYDTVTDGSKKKNETPERKHRFSLASLDPEVWKTECIQLVETMLNCEDSRPFRVPVDIQDYPGKQQKSSKPPVNWWGSVLNSVKNISSKLSNYYEVIEQPMDLGNIRQNLENNHYSEPTQFAMDIKLMFSNSRAFNTNKRSRIYTMTLRLSAMFESRMKEIITTWKRAVRHQNKRFPNYLLPKSQRVYASSTSPGTSGVTPTRPFASVTSPTARSTCLPNGKSRHTTDDDTDVDVTNTPAKDKYSTRKRPKRERRTTQRTTGYNYSDIENFPEPKPDYTDDDFELEQPKTASPKKKDKRIPLKRKQSKKRALNNGDTNSSTRYSTRAATGTIKTRKYTNNGFFTETDNSETEIDEPSQHQTTTVTAASRQHTPVQDSNSDTEIEETPPIVTKQSGRRKVLNRSTSESEAASHDVSHDNSDTEEEEVDFPNLTKKRKYRTGKIGRHQKSKSGKYNSKSSNKRQRVSSKTESEDGASGSGEESSASSAESASTGWEEEPHSPVTRAHTVSQGSRSRDTSVKYDSDTSSRRPRSGAHNTVSGSGSGKEALRTRNRGKQTITYTEDSDDDNYEPVTISSRGRVRKPTARARGLLD